MQKRSNTGVYDEESVPDSFPVRARDFYLLNDSPIVSLHYHDTTELGYCHKGSGVFVVGNKKLSFSAGDVSIIAPGEMHLAQSHRGTQSLWTFVFVDMNELLLPRFADLEAFDMAAFSGIFSPGRGAELNSCVRSLIREARRRGPLHRVAILSHLALIATHLYREHGPRGEGESLSRRRKPSRLPPTSSSSRATMSSRHSTRPTRARTGSMCSTTEARTRTTCSTWSAMHSRSVRAGAPEHGGLSLGKGRNRPPRKSLGPLKKALEHIARNYYRSISIAELARMCAMSERNFTRRFTEALGCPPHQYVMDTRIAMASGQLMKEETSISRIAEENGFFSVSAFDRAFKNKTGAPPREWRRKHTSIRG